jgi:tRNA pseudouridine55 synthase
VLQIICGVSDLVIDCLFVESFLKGSKGYRAAGEFGFETDTLDMAGAVTEKAGFDHITRESLEKVIPRFVGSFMQYPPLYSAIHKDGKRLHELAREGFTAEDLDIPPRAVTVMNFDLLGFDLPKFEIAVQCGSGTYIRSLIRDIGYCLDSVATTTLLQRTKQGPFTLEHTLPREEWTAGNIYKSIERTKTLFGNNPL